MCPAHDLLLVLLLVASLAMRRHGVPPTARATRSLPIIAFGDSDEERTPIRATDSAPAGLARVYPFAGAPGASEALLAALHAHTAGRAGREGARTHDWLHMHIGALGHRGAHAAVRDAFRAASRLGKIVLGLCVAQMYGLGALRRHGAARSNPVWRLRAVLQGRRSAGRSQLGAIKEVLHAARRHERAFFLYASERLTPATAQRLFAHALEHDDRYGALIYPIGRLDADSFGRIIAQQRIVNNALVTLVVRLQRMPNKADYMRAAFRLQLFEVAALFVAADSQHYRYHSTFAHRVPENAPLHAALAATATHWLQPHAILHLAGFLVACGYEDHALRLFRCAVQASPAASVENFVLSACLAVPLHFLSDHKLLSHFGHRHVVLALRHVLRNSVGDSSLSHYIRCAIHQLIPSARSNSQDVRAS